MRGLHNSPMRILVLIHEYPPVGGGGGRVAEDICRGLVQRGHEIRVLTAHVAGQAVHEERDGVRIIRLRSGRRFPFQATFPSMLRFVLASIAAGLQLAREWKPDLIHAHFAVPAGPAARTLSRWMGIPYIITIHLGDVPGGAPEKTDRWFQWVYPFTPNVWKSAAAIIAVSEFTRQLALKHYPVDVQVIPSGIDLAAFRERTITVGQPPSLIFTGRLVEQKNPLLVVHTLAELKDLSWNCTLVGDGPLRRELEDEINKYGLADRFALTGWIDQKGVIEFLERSDVLFMPSRSEGMPIAGIQALATGLAIVAGRAGGFTELVEQGVNGYLFDPTDRESPRRYLRELLTSPQRLLAFKRASRTMASRFDLQRVVDQYESLFQEILRREK